MDVLRSTGAVLSWTKRKTGLVGRRPGTALLLRALIATGLLLLLKDIADNEYELVVKRSEDFSARSQAESLKRYGIYVYELEENYHKKLKWDLKERETNREMNKRETDEDRDRIKTERRNEKEKQRDKDGDMDRESERGRENGELDGNGNGIRTTERDKQKDRATNDAVTETNLTRDMMEGKYDGKPNSFAGKLKKTKFQDKKNFTSPDPAVAYPITTRGRAKRFPQTLIFGVKKCGTETLALFMTVHPDIHYTRKEIHFFDHSKVYKRGIQWYLKWMPLTNPGEITVEKTPNYFEKNVGPKRVHTFNSSIKLIAIVRDPVKRLISDYTHNRQHPGSYGRKEAYHTFTEMVFFKNGSINTNYLPVHRGIYHLHYSNWLRYFQKEQILVLDGEAFMKDPYPTLKRVETFLGLRPFIKPEHFIYSAKKHFFCKRKRGKKKCMAPNKGRKHPNVSEAVISKLQEFYRPHNSIFENMLNYKFSWP